jgi:hypothetical protein
LVAQNRLDQAAERALSTFDQRHLVNVQLQYSTGVGVHGGALLSGWRGVIFKGWTVTSNITTGTGLPLSPVYAGVAANTGISGTLRPEYLGTDVYAAPAGRFLNPLAYAAPPSAQWGNAARDSITGPNQFTMNASMQRTFAEKFDVRFDSTNALNHPNYSSWNTTWTPSLANPNQAGPVQPAGGLFGVANPPGGMRVIQATLRWRF